MSTDDPSLREIRKIAFGLWLQDGQPFGRDREHWEAAKEIWAFRAHRQDLSEDAEQQPQQLADPGSRRRVME